MDEVREREYKIVPASPSVVVTARGSVVKTISYGTAAGCGFDSCRDEILRNISGTRAEPTVEQAGKKTIRETIYEGISKW